MLTPSTTTVRNAVNVSFTVFKVLLAVSTINLTELLLAGGVGVGAGGVGVGAGGVGVGAGGV
ncbi:hypothetical protein, partial [Kingella kingae]|uniref:hypothetical protein n=1 Tax=Kingella kingae TaxID=504 RepID=UPI00254A8807